jgi:hypothetical protein
MISIKILNIKDKIIPNLQQASFIKHSNPFTEVAASLPHSSREYG